MKIELGAGGIPKRWKKGDYIRQDIRPLPGVTLVCDACKLPDNIKGKLTEIYGYHIIEHIYYRKAQAAVNHWVDWLVPGGVIHMIAPDFLSLAQWLATAPNDDYINDRVQYMSKGGGMTPEGDVIIPQLHVAMTTLNTLTRLFKKAGLTIFEARRMNDRQPRGEHCPMISVKGRK